MENNNVFRKATKHQAKLRLAIIGPSGAGKTYTALKVASNLGKRIAVIDTERGSASKYADHFDFDTLDLTDCNPTAYVRAIRAAAEAGYDVCVVDSLSHAWNGKGGALELVDEAARRTKTGNSFGAWREVTPLHNALVDEIVGSRMHIIATMRSKTEWSQEKDERGRTQIRKVGMAPIQRDGIEYEFDVVLDMDQDNTAIVTKTRCPSLTGAVVQKPGVELAIALTHWLQGAPASTDTLPVAKPEPEQPLPPIDNPMVDSPALTSILDAISHAKSLVALKTIAALAAKLPQPDVDIARQAYARKQSELSNAPERDPRVATIEAALKNPKIGQVIIDRLGANGIVLDLSNVHRLTRNELTDAVRMIEDVQKGEA